jgi:uncharacterized protein (DUF433 family)
LAHRIRRLSFLQDAIMTTTTYAHIEVASDGTAYVGDSRTRVDEIVLDLFANGWDVAEIQQQRPYLTLAQIYSALAYYYDHRDELDAVVQEGMRRIFASRADMPRMNSS